MFLPVVLLEPMQCRKLCGHPSLVVMNILLPVVHGFANEKIPANHDDEWRQHQDDLVPTKQGALVTDLQTSGLAT